MTTKDKPKTKGRKKGESDSVLISINQLTQTLPVNSMVRVRRTWLRSIEELHGVKFVPAKTKKVTIINPETKDLA